MQNDIKSPILSSFLIALCYGISIYALQIFLYKCGMLQYFPTRESLINWDGIFYHSIASEGYSYNNWVSNTGFCPMFAWLWKLSHLGVYGICLLNIIIFSLGFAVLCRLTNAGVQDQLLWLSTPSLYFAFIPYPEALFFFLIALTLYGIEHNKRFIVWVALCCSALTRMNIVCLIPTFLLAELISNEPKRWLYSIKTAFINYCLPLFAGLIIFILYQYQTTGVWFAYFIKQRTIWQRVFSIPKLPFQAATGPATLWINALALFICLIALIKISPKTIHWLRKQTNTYSKTYILSCFYLIFSAILVVFYNPKWGGSGTTNVIGAHRYIFASPFFFIFLHNTINKVYYKPQVFLLILILANVFWLAFGSYIHIQELLYFNFNTLLILGYVAYANKKLPWPGIALTAINILLQIILMQRFLANLSID